MKKINAVVEPIQRNLKINSIANIPENFGTFLYSCLGDRVTGQRSSVLNTEFFKSNTHGKAIVEKAKEKKCTIEEYLVKHDFSIDYSGDKNYSQTQAYITAGRKFGVSYLTGNGDRSHTIYFEDGKVFEFLTQEHVSCIKNKEKRNCTQAFLDYRDSLVAGLKTLNEDNIVEINVPVKIAVLTSLYTQNKYDDRYNRGENELNAIVLKNIHDDVVQYAVIQTPEFDVWDKSKQINSRDARRHTSELVPFVAIRFGSVNHKITAIAPRQGTIEYGNLDITTEEFNHTFVTVNENTNSLISVTKNTGSDHVSNFHSMFNKILEKDQYYARNETTIADGVMLNMIDVITHPELMKAINKRIDFITTESAKLQELKHKWANMYFLNSD